MESKTVLDFWFVELGPEDRFKKSDELDVQIVERFGRFHHAAVSGELYSWRESGLGALAEVIVLDQFSRNMYREDPRSFSQDPQALTLAQEAVRRGLDQELTPDQKAFLYMPYMHSESALIHEVALELFGQSGLEFYLEYEIKHKVIVDRFGRYPHRNKILGRTSTAEEIEFLKQPGSSF